MKNIVVGVDFSENSENALRHAVAIGLKTKAKIHIVWVKTPTAATKLDVTDEDAMMSKAHVKLDELVDLARAEAPNNKLQGVILEGKAHIKLTQYATNLPDSLLVVGSHGASGFEEMFVGSNTMKVVGISKVPVLIIGSHVNVNRDLTKVVAPVDTSFETLQKIKTAADFCRFFSAKLSLLGLCDPRYPEEKHIVSVQLNHAAGMCDIANVRYDVTTLDVSGTPATAVVDWAKAADANLIVIMREVEDDSTAFWMASTTRQLLNTAPMPLLIVPNTMHSPIA